MICRIKMSDTKMSTTDLFSLGDHTYFVQERVIASWTNGLNKNPCTKQK